MISDQLKKKYEVLQDNVRNMITFLCLLIYGIVRDSCIYQQTTFMQNLNASNKVLRVCIARIIIFYIFFFNFLKFYFAFLYQNQYRAHIVIMNKYVTVKFSSSLPLVFC